MESWYIYNPALGLGSIAKIQLSINENVEGVLQEVEGRVLNDTIVVDEIENLIVQSHAADDTWQFAPFKKIKHLYLACNREVLSAGLLDGLNDLEGIYIPTNKSLKTVQPGFFNDKINLKKVVINNGKLQLELGTFRGMPNLKELDLRGNQIEELPVGLFVDVPDVEKLTLAHNNIMSLPTKIFYGLPFLNDLDLSWNHLESWNDEAFSYVNMLLRLNISNNDINRLTPASFKKLNSLLALQLDGNYLENLEKDSLVGLPRLGHLSVNNNMLKKIDTLTFDYVKALGVLLLEGNDIASLGSEVINDFVTSLHVEEDWCVGLHSLTELDLSGNKIRHIPANAFESARKLSKLNLRDNLIESIDPKAFDNVFKLKYLDLSRNRLPRPPSNRYGDLCSVVILNLSNNRITTMGKNSLGAFRGVRDLDVSGNPVESMEPDTFFFNRMLVNLRVSFSCSRAATSWMDAVGLTNGYLPERLRNSSRTKVESDGSTHIEINARQSTEEWSKCDSIVKFKQLITNFMY